METAKTRFAVLGAGNGGLAMAGHLSLLGYGVRLWNRSNNRIAQLRRSRKIELISEREDLPHGTTRLEVVTDDPGQCVEDTDIIMVVVPATGHREVAETFAPFLRDGHIVVLHPGRTGGALEFLHTIRDAGCTAKVTVAEAQTLIYACRVTNPGQVRIFGLKRSVPVAALPAHLTPWVVGVLSSAIDSFVPGDNVMKTSLDNIGAVFHPAVMVLNASRIESTRGDFEFYVDGISRSCSKVLERIDSERVQVGAALGFNCMSAREWLYVAYGAAGDTLFDAIRANEGYYGIKAPHLLDVRYLTEDVPASLVPIASIGQQMGIECPTIRSIIHLAEILLGRDFWHKGRTVETMGLIGLSLRNIRQLVLEGAAPTSEATRQ